MKKCKRCSKPLMNTNRSGYCSNCYTKSPKMLEYQRERQKEWYSKNKDKKRAYLKRKDVKLRVSKYQKEYFKRNKDHIRELKRIWERKHRRSKRNGME